MNTASTGIRENQIIRTFPLHLFFDLSIDKSVHMGLSWTSNLEVAEKFAGRFGRQGTIWKTVLEPEKILAAYADDGEHEVLAIVSENTVNNVREFS